jgi:hypothetical protein
MRETVVMLEEFSDEASGGGGMDSDSAIKKINTGGNLYGLQAD